MSPRKGEIVTNPGRTTRSRALEHQTGLASVTMARDPSKSPATETSGEPSPTDSSPPGVDLERFRDRLRYFAARRLRDWAEAEDVAQEALRRTLEALTAGRVEDPKALSSFLFQTAEHICQHRALSAGREKRALRLFAMNRPAAEQNDVDPLGSLISAERRARVREALERLDPGDRELLALTYVEALRSSEIARRLGITEGNVRVRRHRALQRLAQLLGVTEGEDRGLER